MKINQNVTIMKMNGYVDIKKFLKYHKKRIKILNDLLKKYRDRKLVIAIVMLSIESLARIRYPKEESSKKRFIDLFSKSVSRKDAERIYQFYRNTYVHVGLPNPFHDYEDEDNTPLLSMDEKDIDLPIYGFEEYPPETLISLYEELICYLEYFFNKKKMEEVSLNFEVYGTM